jgi:cell division protein FtsQ
MRPLTPFRPRPPERPDPAPSRLSYRMQRLALSPRFRRGFTFGMPAFALAVIGTLSLASEERREAIGTRIAEAKIAIQSREEFMVQELAIDGASDVIARDIRTALAVDFPVSSFDLDLGAMQAAILDLDAVERADLRVAPGGLLEIRVEERIPALVWRSSDGLELIDETGRRVSALPSRATRSDLPLVTGPGADAAAAEAIRLVRVAEPLALRLRGLVRIGNRRWDVVLAEGQKIKLPESGAVDALARVLAVDAAEDLFGREVVLVDMRLPHRPTVRLKPAAAKALRQVKLAELGDD